jgi:hypothetical protein
VQIRNNVLKVMKVEAVRGAGRVQCEAVVAYLKEMTYHPSGNLRKATRTLL